MIVTVRNEQRISPVNVARMARLARRAVRRLRIRTRGTLAVTFIDARRMRALNRRFLAHDRTTDVLSFRYDGEPIVGDIVISPAAARRYARRNGLSYTEELSRYVAHGLLHWLGHEDRTASQQRKMRAMEDQLLKAL
ncbi:MAG: rRNA maturation RNase YbeY [Candidatus Omnitrophota bacterium]|nr:rRNA maturation RNase YbeY [Candidatus Omnitrophota bacterium]